MKIITIIALVLISLTALSQDYIDYEDFTFYQNGEEISLDQVKILTKKYGVGKWKFRTATKQYRGLSTKKHLLLLTGASSVEKMGFEPTTS